jgi:DNA repair photolyase
MLHLMTTLSPVSGAPMQYELIKAKSLLSKPTVADGWFHINRGLNAYRGCEHLCAYCDGMAEHYHVDDFLTRVQVKENAPEVLRRELIKAGFTPRGHLPEGTLLPYLSRSDALRVARQGPRLSVIGVCGGVSDGYQPAEKQYRVTRRILETLLDFEMPVFVLTKSSLVLRDLDLLKEIHERAFANVVFTITLHDERTKRIFEPNSSPTAERFDALKAIRNAGLFGGVMATPIIPGIGDTEENMQGLARDAKWAGAEFILFAGMTLKPGRQKDYFLRVVKEHFPEQLELLKHVYANNDRYGAPMRGELPVNVMLRGRRICQEVGIPDRSVRHMLRSEPGANRRVLQALLDIVFYQSYVLNMRWTQSKPYHQLAATIEAGVEDLESLQRAKRLAERLGTTPEMARAVEEILARGSCTQLDAVVKRIDTLARAA